MSKIIKTIKYPLRVASQLSRLPKYVHFFESKSEQHDVALSEIRQIVDDMRTETAAKKSLERLDSRLTDLQYKLSQISSSSTSSSNDSPKAVNNTVADNHDMDNFYKNFEDKFRGTEEEIKLRVSEHLPLFNALDSKLRKKPVIDIGCGRGEFISVLDEKGFKAIGVDMNASMVERAKNMGLEAVQNDALSYLSELKPKSLAAITGFHIVEHIPFESLMKIFEACYRTIDTGGFVLFETPNPRNLAVGACNFYMDPSHIKPIPPDLLAFALESVGFESEIVPLHPAKESIEHDDPMVKDMMNMLYGPIDYAVVARKTT